MHPNIPKWFFTLGVGISCCPKILEFILGGKNLVCIEPSLNHCKGLEEWISKIGYNSHLKIKKHKLWPNE